VPKWPRTTRPQPHHAARVRRCPPGQSPRAPARTTRPASDGARLDAHREPPRAPRGPRPTCPTCPAWTRATMPQGTPRGALRRVRPARQPRAPSAHREARVDVPTWTRTTSPANHEARVDGARLNAHHEAQALTTSSASTRPSLRGVGESLPFGARRPRPVGRPLARSVGANLCPLARPCEKISARTRARSPSKILGRLTGSAFAPRLAPFHAPFWRRASCHSARHFSEPSALAHGATAHSRGPRPAPRALSTTPASEPRSAAARAASEALWICARAPFLAPFRAPPLAPFRAPCAGHWARHSRRARLGPEHTAARRLEIIPREPPRALEFAPAVVGARPERCAVSERHPAPSKGLSRRAWRREGCTGPAPRVRRTQASRRAWRRAGLHRAQLPVSDVARAGAQQASLEARGAAPAPLPMSDVARARAQQASLDAGPTPISAVARAARPSRPAWRRAGLHRAPLPMSDVARARAQQAHLEARGAAPAQLRVRRGARAGAAGPPRRGPSSPGPTRRALHRPRSPCSTRAQLPVSDVARALDVGPAPRVRRGARCTGPAGEPGGAGPHWLSSPCPTWRARAQQVSLDAGPAPMSAVARARASRRAWRRAGLHRAQLPVSDVARAGAQQASLEARGAVPAPLPMSDVARAGAAGEPRREPNSYVRRGARCTAQQARLEARGATPRPAPVSDVARARAQQASLDAGPVPRVQRGARAQQVRLDVGPAPRVRVRRGARGPSRRN
jgi:hypothetical protein